MKTDYPKTNVMLQQIALVYGAPDSDDPIGFLAAYARLMWRYPDSVLMDAAERLLRAYRPKSVHKPWPDLPTCIGFCEDAQAAAVTRLAGEQNQKRLAQVEAARVYTDRELLEAGICVDRWANGQERITAPPQPPGKHKGWQPLITPEGAEQMTKALRGLAIAMRAKRGRDVA